MLGEGGRGEARLANLKVECLPLESQRICAWQDPQLLAQCFLVPSTPCGMRRCCGEGIAMRLLVADVRYRLVVGVRDRVA